MLSDIFLYTAAGEDKVISNENAVRQQMPRDGRTTISSEPDQHRSLVWPAFDALPRLISTPRSILADVRARQQTHVAIAPLKPNVLVDDDSAGG